ncbi:MAG: hypothetical protein QXU62_07845, partial [Thermofilaceae archaeon]
VTRIGGLKIGFFIMDPNWFIQNSISITDIRDRFPWAVERYLEGLFPIDVKEVRYLGNVSRPYVTGLSTSDSWAWDADTWGEEIGEAGLDRGVMIVPDDGLDWRGSGVCGLKPHCIGCWGNDADKIAIVEHGSLWTNDGLYLNVVAHELSHTFGFPDIYFGKDFPQNYCTTCRYYGNAVIQGSSDGCTGIPRVLGCYAYFDEKNGGIIAANCGDRIVIRDIMACGCIAVATSSWVYHTWWAVARGCMDQDPPDGLLISLIVFTNGTVVGRPFSRLYNHTRSFLSTESVGEARIVLKDRGGTVLRSYPINITYTFEGSEEKLNVVPLVVTVEWFNNLGAVEFVGPDGRVWFSRTVSLNEPKVSIESPSQGMRLKKGRTYTIKWVGSDADGDNLWYNVHIKGVNETSWVIIAHRITENSVSFTIPETFEEGNYVLMVKATDGVNTGYDIVNLQILKTLPTYTLEVSSNIGIQIEGSGTYEEWSDVTLTAPQTAPMEGILGILGGKYVFQEWTGFINTRENPVTIVIFSESENRYLTVKAIYTQDLTTVYIVSAVIALMVFASIALTVLKRRSKTAQPSPPKP